MSSQAAPAASQRTHWRAYVIVGVPVHVPVVLVRLWPSRGVPETAGSTVFTGAAGATSADAGDVASTEPAAFVAVTTTRSVPSTSAAVTSYVEPVAPGMSAQPFPAALQARHW